MAEARCPRCGKAAAARHAPFCSARCQQIDLGRWLKGSYVIPAAPGDPVADRPIPDADGEDEGQ